jgi:mannose-1-phosphate guanylyltransferase/mannose-1-phosphate guanylyltransferase/mannose-6-phosphate isomerase
LREHAPAILAAAEGDFASAPSASIDTALMEKAARVAVVPAAMGWSDIGSWEALHALGPRDGEGNVLTGDVVAPGSRGCVVRSEGPVVVALGVEDLVIVATDRAVLVVPRGESQRVREAIDALEARPRRGDE